MSNPTTQTPKVIYWPTNHNNKLACEYMVHVDVAPKRPLTERDLDTTIIEIRTQDNSIPPTRWKVVDLIRIQLAQLNSIITWPSHGMQSYDFARWFVLKNDGANMYSVVAVYFYERVKI